jgi:hypothetical protein
MMRRIEVAAMGGGGAELEHEGHEEDGAIPGDVQPEFDRTPAPGIACFVTGQGTNPGLIGENDVDNGKTSLITRSFDLTGMTTPTLGYWRWFYSNGTTDDYFRVFLSNNNGANWTMVSHTPGGYYAHWSEFAVRVTDFMAATSQMMLKFVAADSGAGGIVEAAVDDVIAYDAALSLVGAPNPSATSALRFGTPRPNPSRGEVTLALDLALSESALLAVDVFDVNGRRVRALARGAATAGTRMLHWDGRDDGGRAVRAGLYFVRARAGAHRSEARVVRMP